MCLMLLTSEMDIVQCTCHMLPDFMTESDFAPPSRGSKQAFSRMKYSLGTILQVYILWLFFVEDFPFLSDLQFS